MLPLHATQTDIVGMTDLRYNEAHTSSNAGDRLNPRPQTEWKLSPGLRCVTLTSIVRSNIDIHWWQCCEERSTSTIAHA
jgi:hypothetical protein